MNHEDSIFAGVNMAAITNICMTAQLNCELDIGVVVNNTCNSVLQTKPFKRVIIRLRQPKATVFLFPNGKLVSVGCKSSVDCQKSLRCIARMIQKIGYFKLKLSNLKIQNIAAVYDLKRNLNTRRLYEDLLFFQI